MSPFQQVALDEVRNMLRAFLGDEHADGLKVFKACTSMLRACAFRGPTMTILEYLEDNYYNPEGPYSKPWAMRAAARVALQFADVPSVDIVVGEMEAASTRPLLDELSVLVKTEHEIDIDLTCDSARRPRAWLFRDAAHRIDRELAHVDLVGRFLRYAPGGLITTSAEEARTVSLIRESRDFLKLAVHALRAAADGMTELEQAAQNREAAAETIDPRREGSS